MKNKIIDLSFGEGTLKTKQFIEKFIIKKFNNNILTQLTDGAVLDKENLIVSNDLHIIKPEFFPGGDIGKLAFTGSVNDCLVSGGEPKYIILSLLMSEGYEIKKIDKLLNSFNNNLKKYKVKLICGDTKVMPSSDLDGVVFCTTVIGKKNRDFILDYNRIKKDDVVIINGDIGRHSVSILNEQEKLGFKLNIKSDCKPLYNEIKILKKYSKKIKFMRDLTRGGLATCLLEIAEKSGKELIINEKAIPVKKSVKAFCALLGIEEIFLANEGKLIAVCDKGTAGEIEKEFKKKIDKSACIIGNVKGTKKNGQVMLKTLSGGERKITHSLRVTVPRIC